MNYVSRLGCLPEWTESNNEPNCIDAVNWSRPSLPTVHGTSNLVFQLTFHYFDKTQTKSNLGEERVYLAYTSQSELIAVGSGGENLSGNLEAHTAVEP